MFALSNGGTAKCLSADYPSLKFHSYTFGLSQCLNMEGQIGSKNEILFTCQHADCGLLQGVNSPLEENEKPKERNGIFTKTLILVDKTQQ